MAIAASEQTCPKCGAPRRDAARACGRCGLAVDRMASFAPPSAVGGEDALSAAWDRAVSAWDDTACHEELMRLVTQHDAYAWAAAKYRERGDDAISSRQLDRITKATEATLYVSAAIRKETTPKPYRGLTAVLVVSILAIAGGLVSAKLILDYLEDSKDDEATPAAPVGRGLPMVPPAPAPRGR